MNRAPFPIRLAAVPFRLMGYIARALLMWAGADPAATAVFGVIFAGVLLAFVTLPPLNRWVGRRVAAYWLRHRAEQMWQEPDWFDGDSHDGIRDGHTQILPCVTEPGSAASPFRPAVMRRRMSGVRILRRSMRHTTPSSSSDRRSR